MGLPVRQRKALDRIERVLRGSDPALAALYAIFGRLTRDEEIPRFEQLRHGARVWLASLRLALAAVGSRLLFWQRQPIRRRQPQRLRRQSAQRHRARQAQRRPAQRVRHRQGFRLGPRQRVIFFYPLAIALAVTSLVLAAKFNPGRACLPVRAVAAAKNVAKSNLCRPQANLSPVMFGR